MADRRERYKAGSRSTRFPYRPYSSRQSDSTTSRRSSRVVPRAVEHDPPVKTSILYKPCRPKHYLSDDVHGTIDWSRTIPPGSTPPPELVKVNSEDVGMSAGLRHLYGGKEDRHGRFQWQHTVPEDLGVPAEDAESQKWAIIVRHVKVYYDAKRVLRVHSIGIQSPFLKDLLKDVLKGYPGVSTNLKHLEFSGKFEPLIHRWNKLNKAIDELKSTAAIQDEADVDQQLKQKIEHGQLLQDLLHNEFQDTIVAASDFKEKGVVIYEHLWTIFQPGHLIYSKVQGQDRVYRLVMTKYGKDTDGNIIFLVVGSYVDFDGTSFGTGKSSHVIRDFDGTRSITSLTVFPFDSHPRQEEIRRYLIERGSKFESFAGSHYRSYDGIGWRVNHQGKREKFTVKGRIVIDTYGWNTFEPDCSVFVTPFAIRPPSTEAVIERLSVQVDAAMEYFDTMDFHDVNFEDNIPEDGHYPDEERKANATAALTDEQKLMCTSLLRGYALHEKKWLHLFVNAVHDVSFSDQAFASLVLPGDQKEMILGFAHAHQNNRTYFDDVIEGKGRGIVLLLSGPPGVGKTLTAESIAEQMRVPLFMMSAGDLGLDPSRVEDKLQNLMQMCARWNAILLLDEADIFLEERNLHELERNKLVTVFLRTLEYFQGIMFLTTNRVATFDAAFQSRIHISLEYTELSAESRRQVWHSFLTQHDHAQAATRAKPIKMPVSAAKAQDALNRSIVAETEAGEHLQAQHISRTQPHELTSGEIDRLARERLNGRQIKNVLKTAQLMASRNGDGLQYRHIKTVMEATQHLHNATRETDHVRSTVYS